MAPRLTSCLFRLIVDDLLLLISLLQYETLLNIFLLEIFPFKHLALYFTWLWCPLNPSCLMFYNRIYPGITLPKLGDINQRNRLGFGGRRYILCGSAGFKPSRRTTSISYGTSVFCNRFFIRRMTVFHIGQKQTTQRE